MGLNKMDLGFGSLLTTSWIGAALSGIVLFQTYLYYRSRTEEESPALSVLVAVLAALDVTHISCVMLSCYHYLATNFNNPDAQEYLIAPLALTMGLTATITFLVQCFFALRVWKLSHGNAFVTVLIVIVSMARLSCGWTTTAKTIEHHSFLYLSTVLRPLFFAGVSLAVGADVIITISLTYWLTVSRRKTQTMEAVIDKIILYTMETGLLISVVSITALIFLGTMPRNFLYIATHFVISKLYVNTFLATLNTRTSLRARVGGAPNSSKVRLSVRSRNVRPEKIDNLYESERSSGEQRSMTINSPASNQKVHSFSEDQTDSYELEAGSPQKET